MSDDEKLADVIPFRKKPPIIKTPMPDHCRVPLGVVYFAAEAPHGDYANFGDFIHDVTQRMSEKAVELYPTAQVCCNLEITQAIRPSDHYIISIDVYGEIEYHE